jgi:hypothetical protein
MRRIRHTSAFLATIIAACTCVSIASAQSLPPEHTPKVTTSTDPKKPVAIGEVLHVQISADAKEGDDVAVATTAFAPFEVHKKNVRVEPATLGRQKFVFDIELISFETGDLNVPAIELRVVTRDGQLGTLKTQPLAVQVRSAIANEPNAAPKPPSAPVSVYQDDYTWLYIIGGLFAIAIIALITLWVSRYLRRRAERAAPPPPPRPPWEIAVEKLARLKHDKQRMIDDGQGALFVDSVSDVVREYLGGRFGFDGLETTTDEMLDSLRRARVNPGLYQEVNAYLRRCDLVKFAKVEPDQDETDLILAKAQDIVQFSMPVTQPNPSGQPGTTHAGRSS